MYNKYDGLLAIMAQNYLDDLRKEANHQHRIDEAKRNRSTSQWRRQLGQSLVKLGQRLATPEVSTAA